MAEKRKTVSLCIIVKDGGAYFDRCLASIVRPCIPRYGGPALDEIVVLVDSRTSDNTEAIAQKYASMQESLGGVFKIERHDWPDNFAVARERSFASATCDWRGWIDADDELVGAQYVKPNLCEAMPPGKVCMSLPYNYIVGPGGIVKSRIWRERFVDWSYGWRWVGSVHEHLVPLRGYVNPPSARWLDGKILYVHLLSEAEVLSHASRNAALCDPDSVSDQIERGRMLYFRARDLKHTDRAEAERLWRELAATSGVADTYSVMGAFYELAGLCAEDRRFDEAKGFVLSYIERYPDTRSGPLLMGNVYAIAGQWREALRWFELGFSMPVLEEAVGRDDGEFAPMACASALRAPVARERKESILRAVESQFPHVANDPSVRLLRQELRAEAMPEIARLLATFAADHDEVLRAQALHGAVPYPLKRDVSLALHRRKVNEYVATHGAKEFNDTWGPIQPDFVRTAIEDDRKSFGVYGRSLWVADQIWRLGWKRVLDVGCADGQVTGYLAARFPDVEFVGIDLDRHCIEHARKMWSLPNLRFEVADFATETVTNSALDAFGVVASIHTLADWCDGYVMTEVLEHVRHFVDLWRPSKPGLLTTPQVQPDFGEPPFDSLAHNMGTAGHLRIYSLAEILSEVRASDAVSVHDPKNPHWGIIRPKVVLTDQWIVFICVGAPFAWGPESPYTRGLTGSEECVVYLSEALARKGYRVVVCVDPLEGQERIVNGVMWTTPDYLAEHDLYDQEGRGTTVISWRSPTLIEPAKSLPARCRILWLHDAAANYDGHSPDAWMSFDAIVCATEYHRRTMAERYPAAADQMRVVTHGIPPMPVAKKIPAKVIYASSPDRGLSRLLRWWPSVLGILPQAELHVFYGRGQMHAHRGVIPSLGKEADELDALIASTPRVVDHGLVAHPELHRHFAESDVWVYPTEFEEIACLTAAKAQAVGCHAVWSPAGCLPEVVLSSVPFVPTTEHLDDDAARDAFVARLEGLMRGGPGTVPIQVFPSWDVVAGEWETIL